MSEVKRLADADFDDFVTIGVNAYPGMRIVSAEDRERLRQHFLKTHHEDPTAAFYGLYRGGKLLGGMRLHDFTMTMFCTKIKAQGVGFVAVDIAHKKEKVARDMMAFFLEHCQRKRATLALLYPFRPDFYKRMGFGYGTKMSRYRVKPASLPRGDSKEHIRMLRAEDKPALLACYNRYAARTHGMIERSARDFDRLFDRPEPRVVGYTDDGQILGYLVFTFQRGKEDNWLVNDVVVREFVYETREALSELLTFLHTQLDQINAIVFDTQDDSFHHLPLDPRNGMDNLIGPVYHESNTQGVGLMYRVVDTRGIFGLLREHNFGGQNCRLKLSITDSFVPHNHGSTIVHFERGRPHVEEGGDFEVEVRLDISDFSSLLMGVISFQSLYRYGLADISDAQYVDTVNALFKAEQKPVCMTDF